MAIAGMYELFNERWCKQTIWLISDTHFGDEELRAGIPNRISDDDLVKLINSKVGKKDTLIHLGDVGDINYIKQLRGYKILICGNHDLGATNYKREIKKLKFDKDLYTEKEMRASVAVAYPGWRITIDEGYDVSHAPFEFWEVTVDNQLFDEVYTGPLMVGEKLLLSHEPVEIPWVFNIHGHDHYGHASKNHLNCTIDAHKRIYGLDWEPINMNQIMKTGLLSKTESIHRITIDDATERKKKRGNKNWKNSK